MKAFRGMFVTAMFVLAVVAMPVTAFGKVTRCHCHAPDGVSVDDPVNVGRGILYDAQATVTGGPSECMYPKADLGYACAQSDMSVLFDLYASDVDEHACKIGEPKNIYAWMIKESKTLEVEVKRDGKKVAPVTLTVTPGEYSPFYASGTWIPPKDAGGEFLPGTYTFRLKGKIRDKDKIGGNSGKPVEHGDSLDGPVDISVFEAELVVVRVDVTASADTIDGNDSGQFSADVRPAGLTVVSYQWAWSAPTNSGNNPQVNFAAPGKQTTTVKNAHWFAFPDNRLLSKTGWDCRYTVNCKVTISTTTCEDGTPPQWRVYLPNPPATTSWPRISGFPTLAKRKVGGKNEWYVSGIGTLARTAPQINENLPKTSQFYNKVVTVHEGRHVTQWTSMNPWQNLFDANSLYANTLSSMTSGVSEQVLRKSVQHQIDLLVATDRVIAQMTVVDRERDAFAASNAVAPDYLEVDIPK